VLAPQLRAEATLECDDDGQRKEGRAMTKFRCVKCHEGKVRPTAGPGRTTWVGNVHDVPIPINIATLVCDACGAQYTDDGAAAVTEAVRPLYETVGGRRLVVEAPNPVAEIRGRLPKDQDGASVDARVHAVAKRERAATVRKLKPSRGRGR
jgi:hypothetical protein